MQPTQACYWIIGAATDRPAIAIDLHDADGNLTGETMTFPLDTFVAQHIPVGLIIHCDTDSTQTYCKD